MQTLAGEDKRQMSVKVSMCLIYRVTNLQSRLEGYLYLQSQPHARYQGWLATSLQFLRLNQIGPLLVIKEKVIPQFQMFPDHQVNEDLMS